MVQSNLAPLRILMLGPTSPPVGGATVLFESLAKDLGARDDVDVRVLSTGGVRGRGVTAPAALGKLGRRVAAGLVWADVVALHGSTSGLHIVGPLVAWLAGHRSIPLLIRKFGGSDALDASWPRRRLIMWAVRRADLYLVETMSQISRAQTAGLANVEWYPNSRPMPALSADEGSTHRQCLRFAFIGQMRREKGVEHLIEAAGRLPDGATVDLYGPTGFDVPMSVLENRRNVAYRGLLSPDQVTGTLSAYDALVLPSYYAGEGYPGVILEAFAAGIPAIATRIGGIPELVDDETGVVVPTRDSQALERAMLQMIEDPALCARLRSGVMKRRETFSSTVWSQRFVDHCKNLATTRMNSTSGEPSL